jgi:hypothetical protein
MSPTQTRTTVQIPVVILRRVVSALADYDRAQAECVAATNAYLDQARTSPANSPTEAPAAAELTRTRDAMLDRQAIAMLRSRYLLRCVLESTGLDLERLVEAHNVGDIETLLTASIAREAQAAE